MRCRGVGIVFQEVVYEVELDQYLLLLQKFYGVELMDQPFSQTFWSRLSPQSVWGIVRSHRTLAGNPGRVAS